VHLTLAEDVVEIAGRRYHGVRGPASGPPLLLLHGVTRRWQTFLPIIPSLSTRWQIRSFDFRGHGRSDRQPGAYRVTDYVRDAVAFLRHRSDEPAVVYGHSLGAMVAAAVAAEAPAAVRALVLEDPPFDTMGRRIKQTPLHSYFAGLQTLAGSQLPVSELARRVGELQFVDPQSGTVVRAKDVRDAAALRFTARCLQQLDRDVLTPVVAACWIDGYDRDALLRRIACPTLLLQADPAAGGMLTDEDAAQVEALISDCTRVRLTACGHLMHGTRTQDLLNVVHNFLESFEHP
jgi:pimeloyl-ACP methyl ester carboxylesterase